MTEIGQAMARVRLAEDPAATPVAAVLTRALGEASAAQQTAADYVTRFLHGDPVELHRVMAAVDEAGLALERLIEIRNALAEAYRSVLDT